MAGMLSQSNGNGAAYRTGVRLMPASEMSASQRNQTFDATIHQLNLVIVQVNALTQAVASVKADTDNTQRVHAGQLDAIMRGYRELKDRVTMTQDLAFNAFHNRPFLLRLRWLVTGR